MALFSRLARAATASGARSCIACMAVSSASTASSLATFSTLSSLSVPRRAILNPPRLPSRIRLQPRPVSSSRGLSTRVPRPRAAREAGDDTSGAARPSSESQESPSPPPPPPDAPPSSSSAHDAADAAPRSSSPLLYRIVEDIKDVFAVTFGLTGAQPRLRARDIGAEVDLGLRAYPWMSYAHPVTGEVLYKNNDTGAVTGVKPNDFDARAPASQRDVALDVDSSALTTTAPVLSAWERTLQALGATPGVSHVVAAAATVGQAVAASPVGRGAAAVRNAVGEKIEDARETWETSQHPLIVNASYVVDSVTGETESGRAMRALTAQDASFNSYTFLEEMSTSLLPAVTRAFLRMDMPVLNALCRDTALAQMRATSAARGAEGIVQDGTLLNVSKCDILSANMAAEKGMPVILVSALVQYIHCVRNKMGDIVEGSESEIRAAVCVFAVTREYDTTPGSAGELVWKVVEMHMAQSQLYL